MKQYHRLSGLSLHDYHHKTLISILTFPSQDLCKDQSHVLLNSSITNSFSRPIFLSFVVW